MRYRKLRIAWTVAWGLLTVLLIVLWVRSAWLQEAASIWMPGRGLLGATSIKQRIIVSFIHASEVVLIATPSKRLTVNSRTIETSYPGKTDVEVNLQVGLPDFPGFSFRTRFGKGFRAVIPHWFPVLLSATLAVFPWLRWRYSLRTLLIATTLVAVVLGAVVYAVR